MARKCGYALQAQKQVAGMNCRGGLGKQQSRYIIRLMSRCEVQRKRTHLGRNSAAASFVELQDKSSRHPQQVFASLLESHQFVVPFCRSWLPLLLPPY
jgi:hypothetical protein